MGGGDGGDRVEAGGGGRWVGVCVCVWVGRDLLRSFSPILQKQTPARSAKIEVRNKRKEKQPDPKQNEK